MYYMKWLIAIIILLGVFGLGVLMSNRIRTVLREIMKTRMPDADLKNIVCDPISDDHWCIQNKCIAHSLGEVNGSVYTNSMEALNNSVRRGFRVFETDVSYTTDNVPILWHQLGDEEIGSFELFFRSKFDYRYTHMSLEDLLIFMSNNLDMYFLIDSKNFESYRVSCSIKEIIENKLSRHKDIYNRLIIQISSEDQFFQIEKLQVFKYYHYIFSHENNILKKLPFLLENHIHTVSIRVNKVNPKQIELLKEKGVYAYVYAPFLYELDHLKSIEKYFLCGVHGVFTHSITDNDLSLIPRGVQ